MRRRTLILGIAAAALAVVVAGGATLALTRDSKAKTVELRTDCGASRMASVEEAVREMSKEVGFEVRVPESLPAGYRVAVVVTPCYPDGRPTSFRTAHVTLGPEDAERTDLPAVVIDQAPSRFEAGPDGGAAPFDLGPSVEARDISNGLVQSYLVLTADRGFVVSVQSPDGGPPATELEAMIRSLVE